MSNLTCSRLHRCITHGRREIVNDTCTQAPTPDAHCTHAHCTHDTCLINNKRCTSKKSACRTNLHYLPKPINRSVPGPSGASEILKTHELTFQCVSKAATIYLDDSL